MRVGRWSVMVLLVGALAATGCGGDPIDLCEGCGVPTPTPTASTTPDVTAPTPTSSTPTATPTP